MSDIFFFTADEGRAEHRLDMVVASYFSDVTRSRAQQLIAEGFVKVNGTVKNKNYKVKQGDRLSIHTPKPKPVETAPENIPLDIRYEDEDLLVVNKPKGMVVHPAAGHESGTLVNDETLSVKEEFLNRNEGLKSMYKADDDNMAVLYITNATARFCSFSAPERKVNF